MNDAVVSGGFNPGVISGALKKGMRQPATAELASNNLDGATKVAVMLLVLGPDKASEILKVFSPAQAQRVTALMASVRKLDRDVIISVLQDFKKTTEYNREIAFDSDGFLRSLLQRFTAEADVKGWGGNSEIARNLPAFETIAAMKPELLQRYLREEHPQVVATLLALLPPGLAGAVLDLFDGETRDELMLRLALLDRIDPKALGELNDALERSFEPDNLIQMSGIGGVAPVVEIMTHLGGDGDKQVLESIRKYDAQLADQITDKLFIFEDFMRIDKLALQRILPAVPAEALAVALKGATPRVRDFFFSHMTQSMAGNLRVQMDGMPPVRVQEVQLQQRRIVRIAKQMESENLLSLQRIAADAVPQGT
jgi:flagellar motor switch protein FliG